MARHSAPGFCDYASLRAEWLRVLLLSSWSKNRIRAVSVQSWTVRDCVIARSVAESMRRLDSATSLRSAQNDDGAGDT